MAVNVKLGRDTDRLYLSWSLCWTTIIPLSLLLPYLTIQFTNPSPLQRTAPTN